MKDFLGYAKDIENTLDIMANIIEEDENLKEYLYETNIEGMVDALDKLNYCYAAWLYLASYLF